MAIILVLVSALILMPVGRNMDEESERRRARLEGVRAGLTIGGSDCLRWVRPHGPGISGRRRVSRGRAMFPEPSRAKPQPTRPAGPQRLRSALRSAISIARQCRYSCPNIRGDAMFANVLDRQSRRDRLPHHSHRAPDGAEHDRPAHARRSRRSVHAARRRNARDRRGRGRLSRCRGDRRAGARGRRAMPASRLRLSCSENADFAEALRERGHRLRRPAARGDARDGAQERGQGADGQGRRADRAGLSRRQPEPEIPARRRPTRSAIPC